MTETTSHPIFGPLTANSEGYWEATLSFGGHDVDVDLNADDDGELDLATLDQLTAFLLHPSPLVQRCRDALIKDAAEDPDSSVTFYRRHHMDSHVVDSGALEEYLGTDRLWQTDIPTYGSL